MNPTISDPRSASELDFVYYDAEDYAGLMQRMVAIVVDFAVIALFGTASVFALDAIGVLHLDDHNTTRLLIASCLPLAFVYLTVLKRSNLRCPGYWVTGLKIVDLKGRRPSMFLMTMRLLLWGAGPLHPLLDFLFISNEPHRQTVRDAILGTYVVRHDALPAGHGRRVYSRWSIMCLMLVFQEVVPAAADGVGELALRQPTA